MPKENKIIKPFNHRIYAASYNLPRFFLLRADNNRVAEFTNNDLGITIYSRLWQ